MGQHKGLRGLATGLAEAGAAAAALRVGMQRGKSPADPRDRMALEHERQHRQHHKDLQRHRRLVRRLQSRSRNLTVLAVGAGGAAVAEVAVVDFGWLFFFAAPAAVLAAWGARSSRQRAAGLPPPVPPTAPPPPPRPLPPGVPGDVESERLHRLRIQLAALLPAVAGLHEGAAMQLRRADLEAAPTMAALVQRLELLHRVSVEMAGTPAQTAARNSAETVRQRLAQGVALYEELLTVTVQLISAPDPRRAPTVALAESVNELTAYAEGLTVAAG